MASYEKITLKSGQIRYRKYVSLGIVGGRRKSTRITAKTLKELKQKEAQLLLGTKGIAQSGSKTMSEVYDLYLNDVSKTLRPSTMSIKRYIKKNYGFLLEEKINKISAMDIETWAQMRKNLISNNTLHNDYAHLGAFFVWCVKHKIIDKNPMQYLDKPRIEQKEMYFITESEFWQLYKAVDEPILKTAYAVLFYCGLRKSELCGLSLADVQGNELSLHHTARQIRGGFDISEKFKNASSKRIVPLPRFLHYDLVAVLKSAPYPFSKEYNRIGRHLVKALEKANMSHIRVHDLRHSYASMLIAKGVDIFTVSKLMGHSSVTTTSKIYGHLYKEKRQQIVDLF